MSFLQEDDMNVTSEDKDELPSSRSYLPVTTPCNIKEYNDNVVYTARRPAPLISTSVVESANAGGRQFVRSLHRLTDYLEIRNDFCRPTTDVFSRRHVRASGSRR